MDDFYLEPQKAHSADKQSRAVKKEALPRKKKKGDFGTPWTG